MMHDSRFHCRKHDMATVLHRGNDGTACLKCPECVAESKEEDEPYLGRIDQAYKAATEN